MLKVLMYMCGERQQEEESSRRIPQEEEDVFTTLGSSDLDSITSPVPAVLISQPSQPLADTTTFALCGICALAFRQLFHESHDIPFCKSAVTCLANHFSFYGQVEDLVEAIIDGEKCELSVFTKLLAEESQLCNSNARLIRELVIFAVKEGWLRRGFYDSRIRTTIKRVSELLKVSLPAFEMYEEWALEMLISTNACPPPTARQLRKIARRKRKIKIASFFGITIATIGGGTALAYFFDPIIPFVVAGATVTLVGGGYFSAYCLALKGYFFHVKKEEDNEVPEVNDFAFERLTNFKGLTSTIAVSGWIDDNKPEAFASQWKSLQHSREEFCLRYECDNLSKLGKALEYFHLLDVCFPIRDMIIYSASGFAVEDTLMYSAIENVWEACREKAADVGKLLAQSLITRPKKKPVTLIGYSLGAKVIFCCLLELSNRNLTEDCEGIVEDVVLLGTPVPTNSALWKQLQHVVTGRIVNGYSEHDWLLRFMYRTSPPHVRFAGLAPVDWRDRRMINVNLSRVIRSHVDYAPNLPLILKAVGIRVNEDFLGKESAVLQKYHSQYSSIAHTGQHYLLQVKRITRRRFCKSEWNLSHLSEPKPIFRRSSSIARIVKNSKSC